MAPPTPRKSPPWSLLVLPVVIMIWGLWQFRGFVQDDAFISLRYSANLARGEGLVFNPGERTEGFTNMLWTLLGGLNLFLGLPALGIWQLLGILSAFATLALVFLITYTLAGTMPAFGAAVLFAGSTTVHAWSGSGLESGFFTFLVTGAVWAELRGRSRLAFGLLGVAQWTRPEALMAAAALVFVKIRVAHGKRELSKEWALRLVKDAAWFVVPLLALLALRLGYYGKLVPNTYLVKGSGIPANHLLGLRKLEKLARFGAMGLVWLLVAGWILPPIWRPERPGSVAEARERRWLHWLVVVAGAAVFFLVDVWLNTGGFWQEDWALGEALEEGDWEPQWTAVSAIIGGLGVYALRFPARFVRQAIPAWMALLWLGYLYYYVRVGGDLLPMHRLFLPAIPLQAILAALGAARLAGDEGLGGLLLSPGSSEVDRAELRGAAFGAIFIGLMGVLGLSLQKTASQGHFRTVQVALDRCHGQAGRDLQKIAEANGIRPSALAQDMGALPYEGMDVVFIDTIGLTDRPIAEILWKYRYSPYFRYLVWEDPVSRKAFDDMEEELREHLSTVRKPDYAVVNVHLEHDDTDAARRARKSHDSAYFLPFMKDNTFFYKWTDTDYFKENYVLMKAYEYSPVHFLVTYRRRDMPDLPPEAAGD